MDTWHWCLDYASQDTIKRLAEMDTRVEFTDSKLHECESCATTKLKTCLYGEGHPTNTIRERVSFDFVFPITPMGYNGLKGYISWTDHKSRDIKIKLIKSEGEAADYII